ncbi:pyridoxamine 5'-phosphate oxidase family protein [Streptomyces sp. NPDC001552]|uniref:pyridoxamine 5'-phosphate oxidase family protein n=1 Tax=Streptomyces sp. NPDC001552 TaxID=3364587 RepID=UPI003676893D
MDGVGRQFAGHGFSPEGHRLAVRPRAALTSCWPEHGRQVRLRGPVPPGSATSGPGTAGNASGSGRRTPTNTRTRWQHHRVRTPSPVPAHKARQHRMTTRTPYGGGAIGSLSTDRSPHRRPDERIARFIAEALGDSSTGVRDARPDAYLCAENDRPLRRTVEGGWRVHWILEAIWSTGPAVSAARTSGCWTSPDESPVGASDDRQDQGRRSAVRPVREDRGERVAHGGPLEEGGTVPVRDPRPPALPGHGYQPGQSGDGPCPPVHRYARQGAEGSSRQARDQGAEQGTGGDQGGVRVAR